jgi:2-polyprenyl-3-methyl-5-hydroxy-6-metoxy-1,4-benzoquinol methylase
MAVRWRTCPFARIEAAVPAAGDILDLGCGHGLLSFYLAAAAPDRRVVGVDIDEDKLVEARRSAARSTLGERVSFVDISPTWIPGDPLPGVATQWDAIVCVDVLYLLGEQRCREVLRAAAGALAPGGRVVVKELGTWPAWKYRVSRLQERLAVSVLRITKGQQISLVPRAVIESELRDAGLDVVGHRLDRGRLHPHYLVVGSRRVDEQASRER